MVASLKGTVPSPMLGGSFPHVGPLIRAIMSTNSRNVVTCLIRDAVSSKGAGGR